MKKHYSHIQNAYISTARTSAAGTCHTLVIETDLPLPHKGTLSHAPELDTLLTELHDMKRRYPDLFAAVNTVEIREKMNQEPDTIGDFAFISRRSAATLPAAANNF